MHTVHNPSDVAAPGPYSHGISVPASARLLFVSGQVGVKRDGSVADGMAAQTTTAFENLAAVLRDAGMTMANLTKLTIYLVDESKTPDFMMAGGPFLPNPPPAITLLYVKGLANPALLVEVEAIAAG